MGCFAACGHRLVRSCRFRRIVIGRNGQRLDLVGTLASASRMTAVLEFLSGHSALYANLTTEIETVAACRSMKDHLASSL
jgi:23S rRNA C2498 (ribose-2'-O)-methylase RlmM